MLEVLILPSSAEVRDGDIVDDVLFLWSAPGE